MKSSRSLRPRLIDILENISIATGIVSSCSFETFLADPVRRLAAERAIEIISEATRHIPELERERYPEVPWRNIIAIGNKLRHEYQRVDPDIIWDIASTHLADLRPVIQAILDDQ